MLACLPKQAAARVASETVVVRGVSLPKEHFQAAQQATVMIQRDHVKEPVQKGRLSIDLLIWTKANIKCELSETMQRRLAARGRKSIFYESMAALLTSVWQSSRVHASQICRTGEAINASKVGRHANTPKVQSDTNHDCHVDKGPISFPRAGASFSTN